MITSLNEKNIVYSTFKEFFKTHLKNNFNQYKLYHVLQFNKN